MKLLFYDLETTGLDKDKHGVYQMSGRIVIDGSVVETFDIKAAFNAGRESVVESIPELKWRRVH